MLASPGERTAAWVVREGLADLPDCLIDALPLILLHRGCGGCADLALCSLLSHLLGLQHMSDMCAFMICNVVQVRVAQLNLH